VEIVQNCCALKRERVDCSKISGLAGAAVGYDVHFAVTVDAAVDVVSWWRGLDPREIVGCEVEEVLPVVLGVGAGGIRAPFDEEQLVRVGEIAWSFVDLEWEDLELFHGGVWADDVEEAFVVGYEAGCLDVLVAGCGWSDFAYVLLQ
jgi:hypothetical protein